jgi:hypothetical protein
LGELENTYIAPEGAELHVYNVKRRGKTFWYNKLTSREAIFEPSERSQKVKVVHLSHSDDPRCLEAEAGIQQRNRLTKVRSRLREVEGTLAEIQELLDGELF